MTLLDVAQGQFTLTRHPARSHDTFRAWDAADEYLLAHVAELEPPLSATRRVLIVNDTCGALSTALADAAPSSLSDSYVTQLATVTNLRRRRVDPATVPLLGSLDPLPTAIDVVLVKIPKSLALLEYQLRRIAPLMSTESIIVGAAMSKHIHTSTLEIFERIIGPTSTSLALKKARLIHPRRRADADARAEAGADTDRTTDGFFLADGTTRIATRPGVFAGDRLDIGTRFLLDNLKTAVGPTTVVDLGCGNGVLGTVIAQRNPDARVVFIDESYFAVAAATETFESNFGSERTARFLVGDGLADLADGEAIVDGSVDLVVNNPPFHVDHALADETAWAMFKGAHRILRPGGELWVVGNRHLAYHAKLKRLFGNCTVAASNSKFVVLRAERVESTPPSAPRD